MDKTYTSYTYSPNGIDVYRRGDVGITTIELIYCINPHHYGIDSDIVREYLKSLKSHVSYVVEAGGRIGVPKNQLAVHDMSKLSFWELPGYAKHIHGGGDSIAFTHSWRHHLLHNPHHWNHWLTDPLDMNSDPMFMPENYAIEMIADWMGASKAYTDSWDMSKWLNDNLPTMNLHSDTRSFVDRKLIDIGYEVLKTPYLEYKEIKYVGD